MAAEEEVRRAFISMLKAKLTNTCTWYKCTAVNEKTCTILYDDEANLEIDEIMLGYDKSGCVVKPKINTDVLVVFFDGSKTNGAVIMCEESEGIELMGFEFGGIPIAEKLMNNYNKLKDRVDAIESATANGLNAVGASTAASGAAGMAAFQTEMGLAELVLFEEIENEKIKHGKG